MKAPPDGYTLLVASTGAPIAPGFKADIVFLDLGHINYVPCHDMVTQIVFTENGGAVDSVMIGGRMVLDRGRLATIDEKKLRRDAANAAKRLFTANAPMRSFAKDRRPFLPRPGL
jgi:5-methylthioadenosine/S-adenosylhomocysteine deaminase